jgi:anaerobic nitric oxide reductase transcription regulator
MSNIVNKNHIVKHSKREIIGFSAAAKKLKQDIEIVSNSELNVLIQGETGVGKELVAEAIHQKSNRFLSNMVYLNCAALPENIAESELFGHLKGAFTGAINNRIGKFELANKGTLFLDEIGDLSLRLQAKLLRVLQYGDIQRIGADTVSHVDVRIIAATNVDLIKAIDNHTFREDLYHRLNVYPIIVPTLRERMTDILPIAEYILEKIKHELVLYKLYLTPHCIHLLESYSWPGNIRELENSLYRAALVAKFEQCNRDICIHANNILVNNETDQPLTNVPIEENIKDNKTHLSLREATEIFQYQYIKKTLAQQKGNWSKPASVLQVDCSNLHRLANRLGLKNN